MKIGVCAKITPDADARVKIAADGNGIDPTGVKFVVSDYDEYAVEEAIRTKEATKGEVTSFTVGDKSNDKQIRQGCLALGVDKALLLCGDAAQNAGALGVAKLLAAAIKAEGCDIVFTGKSTTDDDSAVVSGMLAELLGWAHVSQVTEFAITDGGFSATRNMDGGVRQRVTGSLPAVITCEDGLNTPRYAKLPDIMKAKRKPLTSGGVDTVGLSDDQVLSTTCVSGYRPPPARPAGRIIEGDAATAASELIRLLRDEAKVL